MLNFKFIKGQFKTVWITILCFSLVFTILIAFTDITTSISPKSVIHVFEDEDGCPLVRAGQEEGGVLFFNKTIFGFGSLALFSGFGISMSLILINRDINRGYIASWLTTPMSRNSIFNSKLFIIILSTIALNIWIILMEMIFFSIRMPDFHQPLIGRLLFGNFALLCYSLFIVSFSWFIFSFFKKTGIALGILIGLLGWFALCEILVSLKMFEGLENLENFKYFTIQSIFNSPLQFKEFEFNEDFVLSTYDLKEIETIIIYAEVLPIKALNFAWQLPVMAVVGISCFVSGQLIIENSNFSF